MPKISLADQLDGLKGKIGGLFSRTKKTTAEQPKTEGIIPPTSSSPSQIKRLAPLAVAVVILGGGGYTFQKDIMALLAPVPSANQAMPLPIASIPMPPPTPAPAPAEEMITEVISEPTALHAAAPEEMTEVITVPEEGIHNITDASDEMTLIDRKLLAMQELQAMKEESHEVAVSEATSDTAIDPGMTTDEAPLEITSTDEAMLIMANNDDVVTVELPVNNDANQMQSLSSNSTESLQSNQWTLWQASNQWAVQVMAVKTKEYLNDFLNRNELEDGATYFEFTRDGEHYYAVVVGVYNTHADANEAAQTIAAELNVEPWVRSMQSIQKAIDYGSNAADSTDDSALSLSQI